MKLNRSVLIALGLVLIMFIWFFINNSAEKRAEKTHTPPPVSLGTASDAPLPDVVISPRTASEHQNAFKLYGRSEANREVQVKAETTGLIASIPAREGAYVKRGALLCRQDVNARQAVLDQATALLKTRELEFKAASRLVAKGFQSETQLATAQAALDGARASVKQAQIELDNVNIRAPFAGIFERKTAEVGDFLSPGQPCGLLVELNPLVVTAELTENQVGFVKVGQKADVVMATGQTVTGTVRQVESRANASTRTFRTEIIVPNGDNSLKAGVSADVKVKAGTTMAQHIPSSILSLNDNGIVGVRYLDSTDTVRFAAVETIDEDADGIWVKGLPDQTRIIVKGQDFVAVGNRVNPTSAR